MLKTLLWILGLDDWECRVPPSKFSRDSAIDDRVCHVRDGACSPVDELVGVAIGEPDQGRRGELVLCKELVYFELLFELSDMLQGDASDGHKLLRSMVISVPSP